MLGRWKTLAADNSGSATVIIGLVLMMVLALAAVVVDLGHLYVVRSEARKAAEAGAAAGCRALKLPEGLYVTSYNWSNASITATNATQLNKVDGVPLSDFTSANVELGWWDTRWNQTTNPPPSHLLGYNDPAGFPSTASYDGANHNPAVKVTVTKREGGSGSGGPVNTFFASILGVNTMGVSTTAVSAMLTPGTAPKGSAFPLAIPDYYARQNYSSDKTFRIGSTYQDDNGGQWTTFLDPLNNVPAVRKLIAGGNPDEISIGDSIYIQPGEKNTLYSDASMAIGNVYLVPVIPDNYTTKDWAKVTAFIAFEITGTNNGNDPYIEGRFRPGVFTTTGTGSGGSASPYTNMFPRMVM